MDTEPTPRRRGPVIAVAVAAVLVVAAGAAVWVLTGSDDAETAAAPPASTSSLPPSTEAPATDADANLEAARVELAAVPGDAAAVNAYLAGPGKVLASFETALAGTGPSCAGLSAALEPFTPLDVYNALGEMPDGPLSEGYGALQLAAGAAASSCDADQSAGVDTAALAAPLTGIGLRYQVLGIRP